MNTYASGRLPLRLSSGNSSENGISARAPSAHNANTSARPIKRVPFTSRFILIRYKKGCMSFYGWKTGLYQCCRSPAACCLVTWCPCLAYGRIVGSLPEGSMICAGDECGASASFCLLLALESLFRSLKQQRGGGFLLGATGEFASDLGEAYVVGRSRELLRAKYRIEKPMTCDQSDCFVAVCCVQCALCQELREIELREEQQPARLKKTVTWGPPTQLML